MSTFDPDEIAEALPRYEVGEELGRGAWGVVLAATHRDLGREVAIKQLPPAFGADEGVRARFRAEARLLASLAHPHIVQIHDFVEHGNLCLLVMEKLDGGTVWDRFTVQGLTMEESASVALAASDALHRAHGLGVLHRDVKPHNLMYAGDGTVKVTDFGIAKVLGGAQTVATVAGQVLGTPAYMSPEQARGEELTPATDVYSIAAVLYELLSGKLPFPAVDSALVMLHTRAYDDPVPLDDMAPEVPQPLVEVVMKGLARDVDQRYATAEEFGAAVATATNELWSTGWLGSQGLVVLASGQIARALSLPPVQTPLEPRDAGAVRPATDSGHVEEAPAPTPRPEDVVPVEEVVEAGSDQTISAPAVGGPPSGETAPPPPVAPTPPEGTAAAVGGPPDHGLPESQTTGGPPAGGGNKSVLVVVAIVAALVVAGLLLFLLTSGGGDEEADDDQTDESDETDETDDETDETDDQTDEGDDEPSEDDSPEELAEFSPGDFPSDPAGDLETAASPFAPIVLEEFGNGNNEDFDVLARDCFFGDFDSCDQLYLETPVGSDYEAYGDTCAGRLAPPDGVADCEDQFA